MLAQLVKTLGSSLSEERQRGLLQRLRRLRKPVWLGNMRRTQPVSDTWGFDRGTPVDRYYIERFLTEHRRDIHGRVLEIKDSAYTGQFGSGVERSDVLDIDPDNTRATFVCDLARADVVPSDTFDCFVMTQTLQLIYDHQAAISHARRMLRPGGVLLITVPSLSRIVPRYGLQTDFWRYTAASCSRLFGDVFGAAHVSVRCYGNVLAATAFLTGLAAEELAPAELDHTDPYFPVLIAVRAEK